MDVLIIDDEKDSREIILNYLGSHFPKVKVAGEADSFESGIKLISNTKFDLLFLDIQLNTHTGFDILEYFENVNFDIIFITAYDKYAIQAIKHHAFDYLLKPLDRNEFIKTTNSYITNSFQKKASDVSSLIERFKELTSNNKIKLPTLTGFKIVNIDDIIYLESDSNYTHIYFRNGDSELLSKTMKEFEKKLPIKSFFRIHHSFIINLNYVKEYIKGRGGQVVLMNNKTLNVSQTKKSDFLSIWNRQ